MKLGEKVLECGPFEGVFPCASAKILDFLLAHRSYDYSISDIARFSGVSSKTALKEVNMLRDRGILKELKNVGNAKMYGISKTSPVAQKLNKAAVEIIMQKITRMPGCLVPQSP